MINDNFFIPGFDKESIFTQQGYDKEHETHDGHDNQLFCDEIPT